MHNKSCPKYKFHFSVLLLIFLLSLQIFQTTPVIADSQEPVTSAEYEGFFDEILLNQMTTNNIAGATVAVVKNDKLVFAKGYGFANKEEGIPVDENKTLFFIGSDGKLFTWTAVMQLVEQGKLDLNADVNNYLDFQIPDQFDEPITMHHLLTHTAGFEDQLNSLFREKETDLLSLREHLIQFMPNRIYAPGEVMAYSNYGTALAGYIVEKISGETFEAYLSNHILKPLEMNQSFVGNDIPENLKQDLSKGFVYQHGSFLPSDFEWTAAVPCAPIRTTASDVGNFMIAHLNDGCLNNNCILKAETVQQMHNQQFTNHPSTSGMAYGFLRSEFNGQTVLWHLGESTRFITLMALIPEQNLGLFVSYNTSPIEGDEILFDFLDRFYPFTRSAINNQPISGWENRAQLFNGIYLPAKINLTSPQKMIGLLQSTPIKINEGKTNLFGMTFVETEPNVFHQKDGNRVLVFEEDKEGQRWMYMGILAFFQVPWSQSLNFIFITLGVCFIIFLSAWVIWPFRKKQSKNGANKPNEISLWLSALLGLFDISLFIWYIMQLFQYGSTFVFPQETITLISTLYWLAVPWTFLVLILTVRSWQHKSWTVGWRIHYSIISLASIVFLWLIWSLNLFVI